MQAGSRCCWCTAGSLIPAHLLCPWRARVRCTCASWQPPSEAPPPPPPAVRHRFLLGESEGALYVCFMGTKLARDMATNANLFQVGGWVGGPGGGGGDGGDLQCLVMLFASLYFEGGRGGLAGGQPRCCTSGHLPGGKRGNRCMFLLGTSRCPPLPPAAPALLCTHCCCCSRCLPSPRCRRRWCWMLPC